MHWDLDSRLSSAFIFISESLSYPYNTTQTFGYANIANIRAMTTLFGCESEWNIDRLPNNILTIK